MSQPDLFGPETFPAPQPEIVELAGRIPPGVRFGTSTWTYDDWFSAPVATLPGFEATIRDYMAMPEHGFDKPFFMGHGVLDTDVPLATTLPYVTALKLGGEPVTFHTYLTNHSGTMAASLKDSVPFVARLFR